MKVCLIAILTSCLFCVCITTTAQEVKLPEMPGTRPFVDYSQKNKGFFIAGQISPSVFIEQNSSLSYFTQIDVVAGFRVNEFIKVGMGSSPRIGSSGDTRLISKLPVYLDLRGNMLSQDIRMFSPYWNLDIGYTINQGFIVSPTLGFRFGGLRHNFLVGLSYFYQALSDSDGMNGASLRLGYEF